MDIRAREKQKQILACGTVGVWYWCIVVQNDANKFIVMILIIKHRFLFYLYTDFFF